VLVAKEQYVIRAHDCNRLNFAQTRGEILSEAGAAEVGFKTSGNSF
jgi:hypothetical protein